MKRFSILLLATMALGLTTYADEYLPLLREGVKWVYSEELNYLGPDDELTFERLYTIEVKGDTVIDNVIYKKIYRTSNVVPWYGDEHYAEPFCSNSQPVACLREEGTKVYAKVLKDYYYDGLTPFLEDLLYNLNTGEEVVLYEFDEDEGSPCTLIGTTTVGNATCKVYSCEGVFGNVVEGVGLDTKYCGDLLMYSRSTIISNPYSYIGLHHMEDADGNIIYKGAAYTENDYIPLLREGVKWVCKETKFDIDESTPIDEREKSRFYTIEIKGDTVVDGKTYKKCYRHSDVDWSEFKSYTIHCSNTEPVALLHEEGRTVYAYNKDLVFYHTIQALEQFRYWSIEDWDEEEDVKFIEFNENEYFKFVGYKPFLGKQCEIYSFETSPGSSSYELIGAFIEGVGFDSDKFGDLLTPYYEGGFSTSTTYSYIGLHHMEDADGNIIYRGKAFTQDRGDVNGDDKIDVEDVNAAVNIILKLKTVADYPGNGDMNGDGIIDVEDVNALINIILKL